MPARSIPNSRKQDLAKTRLIVRIFDFVKVSLLILKIYSAVVKRILINHCINAEKNKIKSAFLFFFLCYNRRDTFTYESGKVLI